MTLKTYTLAVSLAAIIGLCIAVVPLSRSVLEYRSPLPQVSEARELSSLEMFVVAHADKEVSAWMMTRRGEFNQRLGETWRAMYEAAMTQQVEAVRNRARRNIVAYGTLCVLCIALLITHLLWARRLAGLTG